MTALFSASPARRLIPAALFLLTAFALMSPRSSRGQAQSALPPKPRVYAVVFLASWCASCKELGPKAARVLPPFIAQGLVPVQLDMSDEAARRKSLAASEKLGLRRIADGNDGTGFIVLVDARKKTRLGRVTSNMTEAQMGAVIRRALDGSRAGVAASGS